MFYERWEWHISGIDAAVGDENAYEYMLTCVCSPEREAGYGQTHPGPDVAETGTNPRTVL